MTNILSHFETLDILNFDVMLWDGPDNLISFPKGSLAVSGTVSGAVVKFPAVVASVSVSGAVVSAGQVNAIYVEVEPAHVDIYGAIENIDIKAIIVSMSASVSMSAALHAIVGIKAIEAIHVVGVAALSGSIRAINAQAIPNKIRAYTCVFSSYVYNGHHTVPVEIVLPIESFVSRQRVGDPSYSEVTIPGLDALSDILSMSKTYDSRFTVFMGLLATSGGGVLQQEKLFTSILQSCDVNANNSRQMIVMSGYEIFYARVPSEITPDDIECTSMFDGKRTLRSSKIDLYLRPGDRCKYGEETLVVESITYNLSSIFGASMEVVGYEI